MLRPTVLVALAAFVAVPALAPPVRAQDAAFDCAAQTQIAAAECEALGALHAATSGDAWTDTTGWSGTAPCDAFGVTCADGAVREVNLKGNGLSGTIPAELAELPHLAVLDLGRNALTGPIPAELGALAELRSLLLSLNDLTGSIPPTLGDAAQLERLELHLNGLSGPIPPELARLRVLETLSLGQNDLTGPIPPELAELTALRQLLLRSNALTGPIPPELGRLTGLTSLALNENALTGPVPPELGNLTALTDLRLNTNGLTGPVPPELGNLTSLWRLWVAGTGLSGPLPHTLTALTALEDFRYHTSDLCAPPDDAFTAWLASIGTVSGSELACAVGTAAEDAAVPHALSLAANYPNPFNPATRIAFTVPEAGPAHLTVVDLLGREVATLFDGPAVPGRPYEATFEAGALPSGFYLYTLRFADRQISRRMMLAK